MLECSTTLTVGSLSCVNQRYLHTSEFISVHYSPLKITNKCRWFVFRTDSEKFLVLFKVTSVIRGEGGALRQGQPGLTESHAHLRLLIEHVFNSSK